MYSVSKVEVDYFSRMEIDKCRVNVGDVVGCMCIKYEIGWSIGGVVD